MKKNYIPIVAFLLGIICNLYLINAQSINIISVDTRSYPIIQAEFSSNDTSGTAIRNFPDPANNFTLYDGGIKRTVIKDSCPEGISKFSIILVLDMSLSMDSLISYNPPGSKRWDVAKKAAKAFINQLPIGRSECALMTFSVLVELVQDFVSIESADSRKRLIDSVNQLNLQSGTDYMSAFIGDDILRRNPPNPGALIVAEHAKYKPIVIFLTDGNHDPNLRPLNTGLIIQKAKEAKATIYALTLGNLSAKYLSELSAITGSTVPPGELYENLSETEIDGVYVGILDKIDPNEFPAPCILKWETDCGGGKVDLTLNIPDSNAANTKYTYGIPDSVKPSLEVMNSHPRDILFLNVDPKGSPGYKDTTIKIKALKNFAKLTGFTSDPRWKIVNPANMNQTLKKNDSMSLTIRFTPDDSLCHQTNAFIESSACSGENLRLHSGFFFAKDADVGSVEVGKNKTQPITQVICNWTCESMKINSATLKGSDASAFQIITVLNNVTIGPGECKDVQFKFSPTEERIYIADLELQFLRFTFKSKVIGNGSGNPQIEAASPLQVENNNCKVPTRDTIVTIKNTGAVKLNITDLEITPTTEGFSFTSGKPVMPIIVDENNGTYGVKITFAPLTKGAHTATLKITNNSKNAPEKDVELKGFLDTIDISANATEIDFGIICPDSVVTKTLKITNNGTLDDNVTGTVASPFIIPTPTINVAKNGGTKDISINFSNSTEGDYQQTLTLTDELCGYPKTVILKAKVAAPSITGTPIIISTVIGSPKQGVITITNNSNRTINILQIISQNSQFKYISSTKTVLAPGESADVTIEYTPDQSGQVVNSKIEIKGTPCNFTGYVDITGNPGKATAKLEIDRDYSDVIGNTVTVNVELNEKTQVMQSGAKAIDATVSFDQTLLKVKVVGNAASYDANTPGKVKIYGMQLDGTNNDQDELGKIDFEVLSGSSASTSELVISDYTSDNGNVALTKSDGLFTLKPSGATISIDKDIAAEIGQVFELRLYLNNAINLSKTVHKSISTTIEYNGTIFEPYGETSKGTFDRSNGMRKITLNNIPIPINATSKTEIAKFQFKAMLGNARETSIIVNNTKVESGFVNFNEVDGKFALNGVCRNDTTYRLFEPFETAGIVSITPNPTDGVIDIQYNLIEEGLSRLFLTDLLGNKLIELESRSKAGLYTDKIDGSMLNSGSYILILQTPTQFISKRIGIAK